MTSSNPVADNGFFESVSDQDLIRNIFTTVYKKQIPVTFWLKDRIFHFSARFSAVNRDWVYFDLPSGHSEKKWDESVVHSDQYIFASVVLEQTQFFMKFLFKERKQETVQMYRPVEIFKLQRRAYTRIRVPRGHRNGEAKMSDPLGSGHVQARIYDVGAGGVALLVPWEATEGRFAVGQNLKSITFVLGSLDVAAAGVIRFLGPYKDEAGKLHLKLGVEFVEMGPDLKEGIREYVEQEAQKLFSAL